MKKYYWVLFKVVRHTWSPSGTCNEPITTYDEDITDKHPLKLKDELNEKYGTEHDDSPPLGAKAREHYRLMNWKELSKEEYEQFRDSV